uniref:Uncharacterized protein n=1 Tax=Physcomitrium patens TaxID=3218 RepID=A0A2K1KE36_PHYPA|nr:hypothetical protein PHYPA_008420 [Physcomitrium patens]
MAPESLRMLPKRKVFNKEWIYQAPDRFRLEAHNTSSAVRCELVREVLLFVPWCARIGTKASLRILN